MSLTATLRSTSLPSTTTSSTGTPEAPRPFHHEPSYINLNRMLIRYQHLILLTPNPSADPSSDLTPLQRQIQAELWSPLPYYRTKWLRNIEGARNLLLQLERAVQNLKVQRSKGAAQRDLAEKRILVKRLRMRVEEIAREVEGMGDEAWQLSTGGREDGESVAEILQRRSVGKDGQGDTDRMQDDAKEEGRPIRDVAKNAGPEDFGQVGDDRDRDRLFNASSTIRHRGVQPSTSSAGQDATTTSFSGIKSDEKVLLDNSRIQDELGGVMLSMAVQLKQQTKAFQFALTEDHGLLGRASDALERNLSGMEAASKNMAFLTRMSEGEGWLGRLKLYAMIFGMWVVAILLVFIGPKLRF